MSNPDSSNPSPPAGSIELTRLGDTVSPLVRQAGEIALRQFRASPAALATQQDGRGPKA